jgi:hypothetical protein
MMKQDLTVHEFSLKKIVENLDKIPSNGKFGQEESLTPQQKKRLMELVSKFNEYGKVLRCEQALLETSKTLSEISTMAKKYAMTESSDFLQREVVQRDFKQVESITKDFTKLSRECYGKIQQLNALYEDMGHVLGRYYEINNLDEIANATPSTPVMGEQAEEQDECGSCGCGNQHDTHGHVLPKPGVPDERDEYASGFEESAA